MQNSPEGHSLASKAAGKESRVCDVYLSHAAADVKREFFDFLKEALYRAGVLIYVDANDVELGDDAYSLHLTALHSARLVLIVISEGSVKSRGCLDELVHMMEKPEKVMPILYDIGPNMDRLVDGLTRVSPDDTEATMAWEVALEKVLKITGWRADIGLATRWELPQLVRVIVRDVLVRLGRPLRHVADMPVDILQRVAQIKQKLALYSTTSSAVLGLYGMGGIGKTTLANAIFNELQPQFGHRSCFLEVGRETSELHLQQLQRRMLRDLCGIDRQVSSVARGKAQLESRLGMWNVLLVIDDVWTQCQLDALLVTVGQGSHVVVTTRNEELLRRPGILRQHVDLLSERAAMELFSWHAFHASEPPIGYMALSAQIIEACARLPLALTVIGDYLWDQQDIKVWEGAVERLRSAEPFTGGSHADDELWGKLKVSYDALGEGEQQMFLDIACFMLGRLARAALPVWGPCAESMLQNLESRSLASRDSKGRLAMHDQLRDMGRAIVTKESEGLAQCSRVWMAEAHAIKVPHRIEALSLVDGDVHIAAFPSMPNLRLLNLNGATAKIRLDNLDKLVHLEWHAAGIVPTLPSTLVVLDLSESPLSALEDMSAVTVLQTLDLQGCNRMAQLPEGISRLASLRHLDLRRCSSLLELPDGISALTGLSGLQMSGCHNLRALPKGIGELTRLCELDLSRCVGLRRLPSSIGLLTGLRRLVACRMESLPEELMQLTGLQVLDLSDCPHLSRLPEALGNLTSLQHLRLSDCSALRQLPDSLCSLAGMQSLEISSSSAATDSLQRLPASFGKLTGLRRLLLENCRLVELPASFSNLSALQSVHILDCAKVELPPGLVHFTGLQELSAVGLTRQTQLPADVGCLRHLHALKLYRCSALQQLPDSIGALGSLETLDLYGCRSLAALPPSITSMHSLTVLSLEACSQLTHLPESIGALPMLAHLDLRDCSSLQRLPHSLCDLQSLRKLLLTGCPAHVPAGLAAMACVVEGKKLDDVDDPPSTSQHASPSCASRGNIGGAASGDRSYKENVAGFIDTMLAPEELTCSITGELFEDPVVLAATGKTYERWAIARWLQEHQPATCPLTGTDPLPFKADLTLVPDGIMAARVVAWQHGKQVVGEEHRAAQIIPEVEHSLETVQAATTAPQASVAANRMADSEVECLAIRPAEVRAWLADQLQQLTPGVAFCIDNHWLASHGESLGEELGGMLVAAGCICTSATTDMLVYEYLLPSLLSFLGLSGGKPGAEQEAAGSSNGSLHGQPEQQSKDPGTPTTESANEDPRAKLLAAACNDCTDVRLIAAVFRGCPCEVPQQAVHLVKLAFRVPNVVVRQRCQRVLRTVPAAVVDAMVDVVMCCCMTAKGHVCLKITQIRGSVKAPGSLPADRVDGSQGTYPQYIRLQLNTQLGSQPCQLDLDLNDPGGTSAGRRSVHKGTINLEYYRRVYERDWHWELGGGALKASAGSAEVPIPKVGGSSKSKEAPLLQRGEYTLAYVEASQDNVRGEDGSVDTTVQLVRDVETTLVTDARDSAAAVAFQDTSWPVRLAGQVSSSQPSAAAISVNCRVAMGMSTVPGIQRSSQREVWQPVLKAGLRSDLQIGFKGTASEDGHVTVASCVPGIP